MARRGTEEIGADLKLRDRRAFERDADKAGDAVERLGRRTQQAGLMARAASGAFGLLSRGIGGLASMAARPLTLAAVGVAGLGTAFVTMGMKAAAGYETAKIGLQTMLGSEGAAQQMLDRIEAFAIRSPFAFPDVLESTRKLVAMGIEADKVQGVIETLGDAASGLGLGSEGLGRIANAIGQINTKTFPSGEEMRQLADAGIPAWRYLSDMIGKSIPETMKLAEKRQISGAKAITAILEGIHRDFNGMIDAQANTMAGKWEIVMDMIRQAGRRAITPFQDDIKKAMDKAIEWAERFGKWMEGPFQRYLAIGKWGWRKGFLNDEIDDTSQRIYYFGRMLRGVFTGDIRDSARSFMHIIDPSGGLWRDALEVVEDLKNIWGEFSIVMREAVIPAFKTFAPLLAPIVFALMHLDDILEWATKHTWGIKYALEALITVFLMGKAISLYARGITGLVTKYDDLKKGMEDVAKAHGRIKSGIGGAITGLKDLAKGLFNATKAAGRNAIMAGRMAAAWVATKAVLLAATIQTYAQIVALTIMQNLPLVIALTAIITALVLLYFHWDKVVGAIKWAWHWIEDNWQKVAMAIADAFGIGMIIRNWDTIQAKVKEVWHNVEDFARVAFAAIGRWLDEAMGPLDEMLAKLAAIRNLSPTDVARLPFGGNARGGLADQARRQQAAQRPGLAAGGVLSRAGSVVVGENGPEELNLPRAARVTPLRPGAKGPSLRESWNKGGMPARFEVTDGGRLLFELVMGNVQDAAARL